MPEQMKTEPTCPGCNATMKLVNGMDESRDPWFRHVADTDCPLVDNGRQLRSAFCEERNLLECYNVICRIFPMSEMDADEFHRICREADRRRIWTYSGMDMETLPYIMAVLGNVTFHERDHSGRRLPPRVMWAVLRNDKRTIAIRSRDGDGKPVSLGFTTLRNPWIEGVRGDIDWILAQPELVEKLKRFCKEKGLCHAAEPSSW